MFTFFEFFFGIFRNQQSDLMICSCNVVASANLMQKVAAGADLIQKVAAGADLIQKLPLLQI